MNLADAIRAALHETNPPLEPAAAAADLQLPEPAPSEKLDVAEPAPAGNFARLELFLSPEQMANLLKVAFIYHRSVMSLREAAHYLRVSAHALEDLAQKGEVPAFMIDGMWRFPKNAVDEWLALRAATEQEQRKHVA